jgi:hypothetical protein
MKLAFYSGAVFQWSVLIGIIAISFLATFVSGSIFDSEADLTSREKETATSSEEDIHA